MYAVLHLADFALQAVLRLAPGDRAQTGRDSVPTAGVAAPERSAGVAGRETRRSPCSHAAAGAETRPVSARPGSMATPAALFSGTGKKSLVLAVNASARAAGVAPGMTAPQAVARCPALLLRPPNPAAEAEARAALLAAGLTLSPALEDTAPGVCTADLRGLDPACHRPAAVAALAQLAALGLSATAGLARTPLLARYAARAAGDLSPSSFSLSFPPACGPALHSPNRRTGKENEERERADAPVLVIAPADEAAFLAPLPLATAGPPPELAAVLAGWGLRTLGDLLALPRDELVRRFGRAAPELWQRARGGEPRPLHPVAPPREFTATHEFEEAVATLEPLLFLLRRFLDRLALELAAAHAVATELALTLTLDEGPPYPRTFRLPEPTADAGILFRALHTHLETLQTAAPITGLQLRVTPARPLVRQQGLFETGLRDPHGFAETLARVSALVGADRLGTPQPEDTHRPDAVRLVPPPAVVPPPAPPPVHPPHGLPLRRFRPPLPARLEFTATERRPAYVWTERFQGAIADLRGPWLASGDWWQADRAWARTEWDIAVAGGGLYRLLLLGEAYFIEGEYD